MTRAILVLRATVAQIVVKDLHSGQSDTPHDEAFIDCPPNCFATLCPCQQKVDPNCGKPQDFSIVIGYLGGKPGLSMPALNANRIYASDVRGPQRIAAEFGRNSWLRTSSCTKT